MRLLDPLHIGALLFAVTTLIWSLYLFTVIIFPLALLTGLAACIVLLFARLETPVQRRTLRFTLLAVVVLHIAFITVFTMATSVNIGQDPERGINLNPPQWAIELLGLSILPFAALFAIGVFVGLFPAWRLKERILSGSGLLLIFVAVLLNPFPDAENPPVFIQQALFLLGFLGASAACLIAALTGDDPPWRRRNHKSPSTSNA